MKTDKPTIPRDEWIKRYVAQMRTYGVDDKLSQQCAEAGHEADGNDPDFSPEDAADVEISYWSAD